jgi:hypothetical protein
MKTIKEYLNEQAPVTPAEPQAANMQGIRQAMTRMGKSGHKDATYYRPLIMFIQQRGSPEIKSMFQELLHQSLGMSTSQGTSAGRAIM